MATFICALAGLALGGLHFYLLYRGVQRQAETASLPAFALHALARLGLAALVFWWIAQQGALPLLAGLAGFTAARVAVQRMLTAM